MILRELSWVELIISFKVSILHAIWKRLLFLTIISFFLTILYFIIQILEPLRELPTIDFLPISLLGFAIAIFLAFTNNAAYDRWWEARKLWGSLVNVSRSFSREILIMINSDIDQQILDIFKKEIIKNVIGFVYSLKIHLRKIHYVRVDPSELKNYFSSEELLKLKGEHNIPNAILLLIGRKLQKALQLGWINTFHFITLEESMKEFTNIQGACERTRNTPIPLPYKVLGNRLVLLYCMTLPFSIINLMGIFTPLVVLFISYALIGLLGIVDELEEPFGLDLNDLPLNSICRVIEINLLQMIGEESFPEFIMPDEDGILH